MIDALEKLSIAVQRGHRILEFVRQAGGHLTEAFQISFQRDLFAQTRDFGNVGDETERAARARLGTRIDWGDSRAESLTLA